MVTGHRGEVVIQAAAERHGQSPEHHQACGRHSHHGDEGKADRSPRGVRPFRARRAGYAHVVTPGSFPCTEPVTLRRTRRYRQLSILSHYAPFSWSFRKIGALLCRTVTSLNAQVPRPDADYANPGGCSWSAVCMK